MQVVDLTPPYRLIHARHGWMLVNTNDAYIGQAIARYGEYSELEGRLISRLLILPGCVVEVGANMGAHTVALARLAAEQQRTVFAFEPQQALFQIMCANVALNALMNVRAFPFACGATWQQLHFDAPDYAAAGNFGGISMTAKASDGPQTVAVMSVPLDDFLPHQPVALLKIDVEGFERTVLEGAQRIVSQWRPLLYLENDRAEKSRALVEWLFDARYRLWWHAPPLFNPDNFAGDPKNIYGSVVSLNMLGIPQELAPPQLGLEECKDAAFHPLAQARSR